MGEEHSLHTVESTMLAKQPACFDVIRFHSPRRSLLRHRFHQHSIES
jgi:hypothetical protein